MVVLSVAARKTESPLAKRSYDDKETYTSFMDLIRRDSLTVKSAKQVSGAIDWSEAFVQVRDCDEEILPNHDIHSQRCENVYTGKESDGSLGEDKQNDEVLSVAERKTESPLAKRSNDEKETYTSLMDLIRRYSLPVESAKEVSGAIDSSDVIVQVRDCDEDILPNHDIHSQRRENVCTGKESDERLGEDKQNDVALRTETATQKMVRFQVSTGPEYTIKTKEKRNNYARRKRGRRMTIPSLQPLMAVDQKDKSGKHNLSRAEVLGRRVSNSKMNPRTPSIVHDDTARHFSLFVEESYAWVAEEVLLGWFFFHCLGESVAGAGNAILHAIKQEGQETQVGEAPGKVLQEKLARAKEGHCQVEQSEAGKDQDEDIEQEDFF